MNRPIILNIRYNPNGFYKAPDDRFIVSIGQLGIWVMGKTLIATVKKVFDEVQYVANSLASCEGKEVNYPWQNYRDYLRDKDVESAEYDWVGNHRPSWFGTIGQM